MDFIWDAFDRIITGAASIIAIILQTGMWLLIIGGVLIGVGLIVALTVCIIGTIQTAVSSKKEKKTAINHCNTHTKKYQ